MLLLLICWSFLIFGQDNTNSVWTFGGHCRLIFQNGVANVLNSDVGSWEGVSSICDENGKLELTTNGALVWNGNDSMIVDQTNYLKGGWSSTQAALIVPYPNHKRKYFIFTTAGQAGLSGQFGDEYSSLAVSLVDLNANSGVGSLEFINHVLLDSTCEKLTAIRGCSEDEFWVLGRKWNSKDFYAWKVNENGINDPVISSIGIYLPTPEDSLGLQSIGYLKGSYDGRKVVSLNTYHSSVELFDFDVQTGLLSNPFIDTSYEEPYGASFSPDNSKLYITSLDRSLGVAFTQTYIIQYLVQSTSESEFISSSDTVAHVTDRSWDIELGPNGKLYISNSFQSFLSIIHQPNNPANTCGYVHHGIYLDQFCNCGLGLQNIAYLPSPNLPDRLFLNDTLFTCDSSLTLEYSSTLGSYLWSNGDTLHTITVNQDGIYTLAYNIECNTRIDSVYADFSYRIKIDMPNDTLLCNEEIFEINPIVNQNEYTVEWSGGNTNLPFYVDSTNTYIVTVNDKYCSNEDSIHVTFISLKNPNLGSDLLICNSPEYELKDTISDADYHWYDGSKGHSVTVQESGNYWLQLSKSICITSDTINIILINSPEVQFPISNSFSPNNDLINDQFIVGNTLLEDYHLAVYNRWGNEIYTTEIFNNGWDGKINGDNAPDGVYFWRSEFRDPCQNKIKELKGTVFLIR